MALCSPLRHEEGLYSRDSHLLEEVGGKGSSKEQKRCVLYGTQRRSCCDPNCSTQSGQAQNVDTKHDEAWGS